MAIPLSSARRYAIRLLILFGFILLVWWRFYNAKAEIQLTGRLDSRNVLTMEAKISNNGSASIRNAKLYCVLRTEISRSAKTELSEVYPKPQTFWTAEAIGAGQTMNATCVPPMALEPKMGQRAEVHAIFTYTPSGWGAREHKQDLGFESFPDAQGEVVWHEYDINADGLR